MQIVVNILPSSIPQQRAFQLQVYSENGEIAWFIQCNISITTPQWHPSYSAQKLVQVSPNQQNVLLGNLSLRIVQGKPFAQKVYFFFDALSPLPLAGDSGLVAAALLWKIILVRASW